jgi:aldose 1-epimerase
VTERHLVLESGDARAVIHPEDGGRLASLTVDGLELLWTGSHDGPIRWGSYPMAPWAGRTRHGRFAFAGREYTLPISMPPHAIHGVVYDRPWTIVGDHELAIDLDDRWPFRGRVTQRFRLERGGLAVSMALEAEEPMPAVLGWHPWFRRTLVDGDEPVRLRVQPGAMLVRDAEGIPTGARTTPPDGPWDDAFTDLAAEPELRWPGRLTLTIGSSATWWVIYTEPAHALCVEPQSAPPDALNSGADTVLPGAPLVHEMTWRWTRP